VLPKGEGKEEGGQVMAEKVRYATPTVYSWQSYESLAPACDWKSDIYAREEGK